MSFLRTSHICALAACLAVTVARPAGGEAPADVTAFLGRIGAYVERYYATAQRVVAVEAVTIQPLRRDLTSTEFARQLEYDLRVEWTPGEAGEPGEAQVRRTLLKVNGRAPRPKDKPGCLDPRPVSPEPLAMFLPAQQADYAFSKPRPSRVGGRRVTRLEYRPLTAGPIEVSWKEDCVSVDLPGRWRGQVWADETTGEILRVDEFLVGRHDITVPDKQQRNWGVPTLTLERSASSIRYKPVRFQNPEEVVLMPAEIESVTAWSTGTPHLRVRQVFSNYRRFITDGRILEE